MTSVVIAVLTFRRPGDLRALLPLLLEQAESAGRAATVLVVDNDPDASARRVVCDWPRVRYVHEPVPGIATARNRALREADGADLLAFIDDDERPAAGWLSHLLTMQAGTGCAGVVGPVVSTFESPLDPWIAAGGFFTRQRRASGTALEVAATNNLLLDLNQVRRVAVTFDEQFALSGGEDTLFTRRLVTEGLRLLWCAEAVVTDVVPEHRATRRWVLRRAFSSGNSVSRTSLVLTTGPRRRALVRTRLTARGVVRSAGGAGRAAAGLVVRSPRHHAGGLRTVMRGLGMLAGAYGYTYLEYRRPAATAAPGDQAGTSADACG